MLLSGCAVLNDFSNLSTTQVDLVSEPVFNTLLKLCSNSKKMIQNTISGTLEVFARKCTFQPKFLGIIFSALSEKSASVRQAACNTIAAVFERLKTDADMQRAILRGESIQTTEFIIKKAIKDTDPTTRTIARKVFFYYRETWPDHGSSLFDSLDLSTQKAINKMSHLNSFGAASQIPITQSKSLISPQTSSISEVSTSLLDFAMIIKMLQMKDPFAINQLIAYLDNSEHELITSDVKSKLKNHIIGIFNAADITNISRLEFLVKFDNIQLLERNGIVSSEDILIPLIKVYMSNTSESIQININSYLDTVREKFTNDQLLKLLVNLVPSITSRIPTVKVDPQCKERENLARAFIFAWIKSILETQAKSDPEFLVNLFSNDAIVRLFLAKLVPLIFQFSTLHNDGAEILRAVFIFAEESFWSALGTFEEDTINLIRSVCRLQSIESQQHSFSEMQQDESMLCDTSALNLLDISMTGSEAETFTHKGDEKSEDDGQTQATPSKELKCHMEITPKQKRATVANRIISDTVRALQMEQENISKLFEELYELSRNVGIADPNYWRFNCDPLLDTLLAKLLQDTGVMYIK